MSEYISDTNIIEQIRWLTCPNCRRKTKHTILSSIHVNYENEPEPDYAPFTVYYQFVACQGCQSLSVRDISLRNDWNDYYAVRGDPEVECDGTITLYDSIENDFGDIICYREHIPAGILRIYESIDKSIHFAEPMLSGIGIRILIESICNEQGFSEISNLHQKINRLQKGKKISSDAAEILHKLRLMGNESAHEAHEPTEEQISLAVQVIRTLILNIYVFPKLAKKCFPDLSREVKEARSAPNERTMPCAEAWDIPNDQPANAPPANGLNRKS